MSVRAYRVTRLEVEESDTFNLWHDDSLVDFLDSKHDFCEQLNSDGVGLVELPIEAMEEALQKVVLSAEGREAITRDIETCRDSGFIKYYCF